MNFFYERIADKRDYHFFRQKNKPFTSPHFHSAQEFVLVKKGTMYATIGGKNYEIGEGHGCFIPRFNPHSYSYQDEQTEVYTFVGDYACFEPAFRSLGGVPPTKFTFDDYPLLENAANFYISQTDERLKKTAFIGMVSLLLAKIAAKNVLLPTQKDSATDKICAALEYVENNSEKELSLPILAEKFGYSPQHFSRLFHEYMPVHLNEYINSVRIARARRKIEEGVPVSDAAFSSGFSSLETFYRVYKKLFGKSPNAKK